MSDFTVKRRDSTLNALSQRLAFIHRLKMNTVDFHNFGMDDGHCTHVCKSIAFHPFIEVVDFQNNRLSERGACAIAALIRNRPTLQKIRLASNHFGYGLSVGVGAICRAIIDTGNLYSINLSSNEIGIEAAAPLSELISANTRLRHLDLSKNRLGSAGAGILANAMEENTNMFSLVLHDNNADPKYLTRIERIVRDNLSCGVHRIPPSDLEDLNTFWKATKRQPAFQSHVENDMETPYFGPNANRASARKKTDTPGPLNENVWQQNTESVSDNEDQDEQNGSTVVEMLEQRVALRSNQHRVSPQQKHVDDEHHDDVLHQLIEKQETKTNKHVHRITGEEKALLEWTHDSVEDPKRMKLVSNTGEKGYEELKEFFEKFLDESNKTSDVLEKVQGVLRGADASTASIEESLNKISSLESSRSSAPKSDGNEIHTE